MDAFGSSAFSAFERVCGGIPRWKMAIVRGRRCVCSVELAIEHLVPLLEQAFEVSAFNVSELRPLSRRLLPLTEQEIVAAAAGKSMLTLQGSLA